MKDTTVIATNRFGLGTPRRPRDRGQEPSGVLADHLKIPDKVIDLSVFPDSAAAPQVRNLVRA